ncbi:NACHT, LRR and PYD domains-containing protein 6 [Galemys pyrenaicus]|uniref:NACHT, LRR and PYD domains-containing protein 6 n=1 Tax=Galemys pyrenaicus TaxID=202257 RepID=A0A8J6ABF9_GALPY|nr:NACHT, LRR and PYD domains-containing protein 6 [Galemys pyrenaicus]
MSRFHEAQVAEGGAEVGEANRKRPLPAIEQMAAGAAAAAVQRGAVSVWKPPGELQDQAAASGEGLRTSAGRTAPLCGQHLSLSLCSCQSRPPRLSQGTLCVLSTCRDTAAPTYGLHRWADPEAERYSVDHRAAVARELLLAALEDLSQEQLKRFRHKLRDAPLAGRSIPWGRLESADVMDLTMQLTTFYGPEPALDVARQTLKRADVRDVAARLKEQRLQRERGQGRGKLRGGWLGPGSSALVSVSAGAWASAAGPRARQAAWARGKGAAERGAGRRERRGAGADPPACTEYKKKYREHVLRQHAKVKERNARSVKINKRFTKLLIAPEALAPEDDAALGPAEEPPAERARRSDTHTFNRLFGRDDEGHRPLTVVLQGPAGIGKTMAAKKILYDWAAGKLYHGQVDFAFFLPCRELLEGPGTSSLADMLLEQCPDRGAPVRQMLAQSERLLFILDGGDEVPADTAPCTDPFEAAGGARVLGSLLSKALLPQARLLVTSRAAIAGRLQGRLSAPQWAEVRGFSDKDKKKYFYKFFKDEGRAERAYRFVKENETLFGLCFVPCVCWIVCTVLRQQLELGQDLSRTSKTTTAVYLLFITSVLSSANAGRPQVQAELRQLCSLAREGILGRRTRFPEEDLERLGLHGSTVQALFLSKRELPGVLETQVTYQFMDQSFQEFLAALSYLLEEQGAPGAPAADVGALLRQDADLRGDLTLTTRFLFGLLSAERMRDIERHFGCAVPERVKQDVLRWVQEQGPPRAAPELTDEAAGLGHPAAREQGEPGEPGQQEEQEELEEQEDEEEQEEARDFPLELLYCLYETQEGAFVRQALRGLPRLVLQRAHLSPMDMAVLSYCVRCCPAGQALQLTGCRLVAAREKKKKSLMRRLQGGLGGGTGRSASRKPQASLVRPLCEAMTDPQCGLSSLTLAHCKIPDLACRDLSAALRGAPRLAELGLLHNGLTAAGLRALAEGLAWPQCQVHTLRLQQPGLQEALQCLLGILHQRPALTTLDLSGCWLAEPTVTCLCAALRHPVCGLQTLRCGGAASPRGWRPEAPPGPRPWVLCPVQDPHAAHGPASLGLCRTALWHSPGQCPCRPRGPAPRPAACDPMSCALRSLASVELSQLSLQELQAVKAHRPGLVIEHPALDGHSEPALGFSSSL